MININMNDIEVKKFIESHFCKDNISRRRVGDKLPSFYFSSYKLKYMVNKTMIQ